VLILSRKQGEEVFIGDEIRVVVIDFRGENRVRLGFIAPAEVEIDRREVREDKIRRRSNADPDPQQNGPVPPLS
jgi:carbon storage regulator